MRIPGIIRGPLGNLQHRWYSRRQAKYLVDLSFTQAAARYPVRNAVHSYMHHYFAHECPEAIRNHRNYFKRDNRGFGEDAFHAMWWLLMRECRPRRCLEIGVYRGQVISLWALIAQLLDFECYVSGISPFTSLGDSVSKYQESIDYYEDVLGIFKTFSLSPPVLVRASSIDAAAVAHIRSQDWDLIYIDGSHDFEVVLLDYQLSRNCLAEGGVLVLDDASVGTSFRPPLFSFAGHPGPSRVASEWAMKELKFLGAIGHNNVFFK